MEPYEERELQGRASQTVKRLIAQLAQEGKTPLDMIDELERIVAESIHEAEKEKDKSWIKFTVVAVLVAMFLTVAGGC